MYVEYQNPKSNCRTVSVVEAAEIWGFSPQTVYNAIDDGVVKVIRITKKRIRISMTEVERVLNGGIL
jgi:predicted site-specific integrase-resolvase